MADVTHYAVASTEVIPNDMGKLFSELVSYLSGYGFSPRTGGEKGAEEAVLRSASELDLPFEDFLPWAEYNGRASRSYAISPGASALVRAIHPKPESLKPGVLRLHGRRVHQVLGAGLNTPAECVLMWFPEAARRKPMGLDMVEKVAAVCQVPVLNIADPEFVSGWGAKRLSKRIMTLGEQGSS